MENISQIIAKELQVKLNQVEATIKLLDEGATVPFIARYRKEVTGGLTDVELRVLEERLGYLRELNDRRETILNSIKEQGKLTKELEQDILAADTKARLEDLYKPFKPKRRTKGQIAIEAGLLPLAEALFKNPDLDPEIEALKYISKDKNINEAKEALDGAKYILMEKFADDADLVGKLRDLLWNEGKIVSKVIKAKESEASKFKDYFDFNERINKIPSHRALAILRGRNENFLNVSLEIDKPCENIVADHFEIADKGRKADNWLLNVAKWTWQVKLKIQLEIESISKLREQSELEAIKVFAENLNDLLMSPPAGYKNVIGIDPGLRTGTKLAVIDGTGKLLEYSTIYPHPPQNQWDEAINTLAVLCKKYNIELISIGNGTASRETEKLIDELVKKHNEFKLSKIVVSEAGASVYSASELATKEFPDIDVSIRGAISIARRIQDPLAELVKIEPKSIGVGQYQHDVNQTKLSKSLNSVVEDCVNKVGVDLNTASAPLLARVSGLNNSLAKNIVEFREKHGAFKNRDNLKQISRLGDKVFEQAAGFLRINNGDNPLDASGVHPESYSVVQQIMTKLNKDIKSIIGNSTLLKSLNLQEFTNDKFGLPTIKDIINELEKPGRDPRSEFKTVNFKEGIEAISDLKPGMILEGIVTNVAKFGAFVDCGVHQDGLVHISEISDKFIKDPRDVIKVGEIVTVKVLDVDIERKRINFSLKLNSKPSFENHKQSSNNKDAGTFNFNQKFNKENSNNRNKQDKFSKQKNRTSLASQRGESVFASILKEALEDVTVNN